MIFLEHNDHYMNSFYDSRAFCEENLGTKYVEARTPPLDKSFQESNSSTAMFFILSPGVDPLKVTTVDLAIVTCTYHETT